MFNPDEPKEIKSKLPTHPPPPAPARVMSEADSFRFYLKESSVVLSGCGIGFDKGRPVVVDQAKVDKIQGWRKDVLRSVWKELNEAYAKKEGSKSPPLT